MKKCRFTEKQIVTILKESDAGTTNADICRQYGISVDTGLKAHLNLTGKAHVFFAPSIQPVTE